MKKFQKIISLVLILTIIFSTFNIYAQSNKKNNDNFEITSEKVPADITKFAKKHFCNQIKDVINNPEIYRIQFKDENNIKLGKPIKLYEYKPDDDILTDDEVYYFPILENKKIIGIYVVFELKNGELSATLSKGFANELENLKSFKSDRDTFKIVKIGQSVNAVNNKRTVTLEKDKDDNFDYNKHNEKIKTKFKSKKATDETIEITNANEEVSIMGSDPGAPIDYKYHYVPIVRQGYGKPWCWAATCASIINYKKGYSLSAEEVVTYVYGYPNTDDGGTWSEMKKAYNHWGVYPYQYGALSFSSTKNVLKYGNEPIHVGMYSSNGFAHSMTLRGFEEYSGGEKYYQLIDPNKSYGVSVIAYDYGYDVSYYLDGRYYYWRYARY